MGDPSPASLSDVVSLRRNQGSMPPSSFPPTAACDGTPFPPPGPNGSRSPASAVLRGAPTPPAPSPRPCCAWPVVPAVQTLFAPTRQPCSASRPGSPIERTQLVLLAQEIRRSPRFLGKPSVRAPLFDPGEPGCQATRHPGVAFRCYHAVGARKRSTLSRLNDAAHTLPVYASQPGSPRDHATLGTSCWPSLTGRESSSRWLPNEVSGHDISVLLDKAYPGARQLVDNLRFEGRTLPTTCPQPRSALALSQSAPSA